MDKQILKAIIGERQKEITDIQLVERPISFEDTYNYVLVGIRRAGKSYLMLQNMKSLIKEGVVQVEDCLYVNFEDERLSGMKAEELGLLLDCYFEMYGDKKPHIYLDEIQLVDGWEKFVRRLADQKYRVMVTGSNAKMLGKEIATTLGGRFIIREVFPFSYYEYLRYHDVDLMQNWEFKPDLRLKAIRNFEDYFQYGGFAELFRAVEKREWLNSLYQKILLGDIVARNAIRGDRTIRLLGRKIAESVMQASSLSRLQHIIKSSGETISLPTLKDYLQFMESSYLIFSIPNYASPFSDQETIKKRYFYDNGILNNLIFDGETKLLENIVAIDLLKKYSNTDEPRLFYYNRNIEVDFYVPEERLAVQASFSIDDINTRERETYALTTLNKAFPLRRAVIITRDQEETIILGELKIEVIPIWKWLLKN